MASLMNGVTLKEIKVYPITSPNIRYKAVILAKLSIAKKMNKNVEFVINKKEETSETKVNLDKIRKYTRRYKFRDPEIGLKELYLSDN